MKCKTFISLLFTGLVFTACRDQTKQAGSFIVIGAGQMPNIAIDQANNLHVVYGSGDSILHAVSSNNGNSFSDPAMVAILPKLAASHMRGPQIAAAANGLIVIAVDNPGNIYSYTRNDTGNWTAAGKVNDADTVAKEGLMAVATSGKTAFAAWLDLRDAHNKIMGAKSTDGGKTWSTNILIYVSPDTTVCECCKPSVAVKGEKVYVMFRNWLQGNRDMYLVQSADGGSSFGEAKKLGNDSWALNGCPMDGGGMLINSNGVAETVWRRKQTIYACTAGQPEKAIGEGKACTIERVNGKNIYAWIENGDVVVTKPDGTRINLGKGQLPLLKGNGNAQVICVWENEKQIQATLLPL